MSLEMGGEAAHLSRLRWFFLCRPLISRRAAGTARPDNFQKKLSTNIDKSRLNFKPSLSISQHKHNIILFNQFKEFLNCGNVYDKKAPDGQYKYIQYQVSSNKDIKYYILPHFEKYPLMSYKKNAYQVWSELIGVLGNEPSERGGTPPRCVATAPEGLSLRQIDSVNLSGEIGKADCPAKIVIKKRLYE